MEKWTTFFITLSILSYIQAQFYLPCESNEDCNQITRATCSSEKVCKCKEIDETLSSDMTKCLRVANGISSACEDSLQCSSWLLVGSECNPDLKQCSCVKGFHYRNGSCRKSSTLNEKCTVDDDCYNGYDIEALKCESGKCVCNSELYYDRLKIDCRRIGAKVGDPCVVDVDCKIENGVCNEVMYCALNTTVPSRTEAPLNKFEQPRISQGRYKRAKDSILGKSCTENQACSKVQNAYCFGTCRCKKGYSTDTTNDACTVEMGQVTENENDCKLFRNSEHRDRRCLCKIGFFYSPNNAECIKPTRVLNHSCTSDLNCKTFGTEAVCISKRCKCNENAWFDENNSICRVRKRIGEVCADDDDCFVTTIKGTVSPTCKDNICSCSSDSYALNNEAYCQLSKVDIGGHCKKKKECTDPNSACSDNICTCKNKFYFDEATNSCLPGIGHSCIQNEECHIEFSICAMNEKNKSYCQCADGYIPNNHKCYKELESIEDPCTSDFQCLEKFEDSISCQNNKCKCNDGFHFNNNKCWPIKHLEDVCNSNGECYVNKNSDAVECRNSQCLCKFGYKIGRDRKSCEKSNGKSLLSSGFLLAFLICSWILKYDVVY